MSSIGFIILRHVNNKLTNKYWIHCYNSIRKYYPENSILIIDDNSNYQHVTNHVVYNTTIIQSYMKWGTRFHEKETCNHLPLIKVWTGR